ncbi:uncharacterized mitochondrial protein AtMg00820-like [Nicotiana sylvestris]|uniref:uncharacterized mitochondrial protein AtMg00820-like n=1 Tax=Nicotiana sylvestris TaxID=4096 RepID=UPI00388CC0A7
MSSSDAAFWKEAIDDEMDSIISNNTWVLVDLPLGSKPIGCKWVFGRKYNIDGSVQTFKARLVAKGIKEYNTPYDSSLKLSANTGRAVAQLKYTSAIGSMMYVMHYTRPDITFVVCKLSRFTSNPSNDHCKAISRVLGYLKYIKHLGICYNSFPNVLEGYSDASWITSVNDNKSTS